MNRIADVLRPTCPVFYVDNVAYYMAKSGVDLSDFPQITPPFEHMWMEFNGPAVGGGIFRAAVYMETRRFDDEGRNGLKVSRLVREEVAGEVEWCVRTKIIGPDLRSISPQPLVWIRKDGSFIGMQCTDDGKEIIGKVLGTVFLACSLMHCKNVRHVENIPGGKFERAKRRRGEEPSLRFYTLEIDAMKQVLRTEGGSESTGLKQALHICRGHFKDYRQSGLFGKIKGIFWWDSNVRGSVNEGAVLKDYAVNAPIL